MELEGERRGSKVLAGIVKDGKIILHKNHNHDPDNKIYDRLSAWKTAREGVKNSSHSSKQAFDDSVSQFRNSKLWQLC